MQYAPRLLVRLIISLPLLPLLLTTAWLMPNSQATSGGKAKAYRAESTITGRPYRRPALESYVAAQSPTSSGKTITVNTTNDIIAADGRCSLREALMAANDNRKVNECSAGGTGMDTIKFNLGGGTPSIKLNSPLPNITDPIQIVGNSGLSTRIEINGSSAGAADGITLAQGSSGSIIGSLVINHFNGAGIYIQPGVNGNTIKSCYIGTDSAGQSAAGNSFSGIEIENSSNNVIGGAVTGDQNVISGNSEAGIFITGTSSTGNSIQGNLIGTDVNGQTAIPNTLSGMIINQAPNNTIGGIATNARNVISGNGESGIFVNGSAAAGNKILGNLIGTDVTGFIALSNSIRGISLIGAPNNTIGGTETSARNVIAANRGAGVGIFDNTATGNQVLGNFIGINAAGNYALGNGDFGVVIEDASSNRIGGTASGARNVISANIEAGIIITGSTSTNNSIEGNFIGTNASGTGALGNAGGVAIDSASNNVIGGADSSARNVISGNFGDGIVIGGGGNNRVENNFIGTTADGLQNLGNLLNGVMILESSGNTVGGTTSGKGNVIAYNQLVGVLIAPVSGPSNRNSITGNSIFNNTQANIDISGNARDTFTDGLTGNDAGDADSGTNNYQNFPVIASVTSTGIISGSIDSLPTNTAYPVRIEFFANSACHATGQGGGESFLGFTTVTSPGNFTAQVTLPSGKSFVTATATDANGNTSEFSACRKVNSLPTVMAIAVDQPAGSAARRQIAKVNDIDQSPGALVVSLTQLSGSGLSISNQSVDAAGNVFADVVAACTASNTTLDLTVRDELGEKASAIILVHPTSPLLPTLGTYANQTVGQGATLNIIPSARPGDDGGLSSVQVTASAGFAGQVKVNAVTGTVNVTNANPPGNYTITVTAIDNCGLITNRSFQLTVDKVVTTLANSATCLSQGSTIKVDTQITHYGPTSVTGSLILSLPSELTAVPNSCQLSPATGACNTNDSQLISWTGTLTPGQTVSVSFDTQLTTVPAKGSVISISSFASFESGTTTSYSTNININCEDEPGVPYPATARVSDDKPGSVLFFPIYSSTYDSPQSENTRLSLTNLDKTTSTQLHVFFVNNNGGVASSFLCLAPLQTMTMLVSDYDPGVRGYILAIAVDATGCPIKFNNLIGSEQIKLASGHAASLSAIAFAAIAETPVICPPGATTATLKFDGVNYNPAPRTLALSNIASPADGNEHLLILDLFGGDFSSQNVGALGDFTGLFYDAESKPYSFSFSSTQPQFQKIISDSFPRTQPRWSSAVTSGKSGWMRFASNTNRSVIGVSLSKGTNLLPYSQGHNLHYLDFTNTATLTIPLIRPVCQ